jgi:hypothetical protein
VPRRSRRRREETTSEPGFTGQSDHCRRKTPDRWMAAALPARLCHALLCLADMETSLTIRRYIPGTRRHSSVSMVPPISLCGWFIRTLLSASGDSACRIEYPQ